MAEAADAKAAADSAKAELASLKTASEARAEDARAQIANLEEQRTFILVAALICFALALFIHVPPPRLRGPAAI